MSELINHLKEHFKNTPKEQLGKELDEIYSKYGHIGPTIEEYLESVSEQTSNPEIKRILEDYERKIEELKDGYNLLMRSN